MRAVQGVSGFVQTGAYGLLRLESWPEEKVLPAFLRLPVLQLRFVRFVLLPFLQEPILYFCLQVFCVLTCVLSHQVRCAAPLRQSTDLLVYLSAQKVPVDILSVVSDNALVKWVLLRIGAQE